LRDLLFYWWYNKKNYGGVVGRSVSDLVVVVQNQDGQTEAQ
jgi:hypothetical protein